MQVEGLDGDNARAVVRLAVSNDVLTISQHAVQLVSKKEFVKKSQGTDIFQCFQTIIDVIISREVYFFTFIYM